ncbi:family 2 glycosyl transferase [Paenibacillus darwinianus]|uniref:Family 2 glycosyl transferase n=1 Tax=Paenibacillus darwinianus TaxID=1380763 RepID=A0A9W5RZJ9_9BACL|nr:hypothetical protein [Paenibacillus darwinianus]EXX84919.1 family 2 glycosyl transferase [Paenibacillus darwinianus]EXX85372.1 family 2 glycosyl transferase [Paenibacillus darwinianus]EXX85489.1 family 2 glycosyl transferase [Paenibacillus darwinianus]
MKRTGKPCGQLAPRSRWRSAGRGKRGIPGRRPVRGSAGTVFGRRGLRISVVVTGGNGREAPLKALPGLGRLRPRQIIVLLHGEGKVGLELIRSFPKTTVIHTPEPLGHRGERCAGARLAEGDAILFVDGTVPADAQRLRPLLKAVRSGVDLALEYSGTGLVPFSAWDDTMRLRAFLNSGLSRPDLGASSMSDLPYALSRRALRALGADALAEPAKAHAAAITRGLRVRACGRTAGRGRVGGGSERSGVHLPGRRSIDEHIEALREAMSRGGARLGLIDAERRRSAARGGITL